MKPSGGLINKMEHAVCKTCEDGREFIINRLPLSGNLRVCPTCGESNFEIWSS